MNKTTVEHLSIALEREVVLLDSAKTYDIDSLGILNHTNEGLFRKSKDNVIKKALVESYEVEEDGLTWTFHLKKGMRWSNDVEITAHDFVYAFRRNVTLNEFTPFSFFYREASFKNIEEILLGDLPVSELGVKAGDDYTLVFELSKPIAYMESLLTYPVFLPINEEFCVSKGDEYGTSIESTLISGPYSISKWDNGNEIVLLKNDKYYNSKNISVEETSFKVVKEYEKNIELYKADGLDVIDLWSGYIKEIPEDLDWKGVHSNTMVGMQIQKKESILSNINARKALSYAIDREYICNNVLSGLPEPANYLIPYNFAYNIEGKDFRDFSKEYISYDSKTAENYWNKAKDELGIETAELGIIIDSFLFDMEGIAETIKNQLTTNLEGLEVNIYIDRYSSELAIFRSAPEDAVLVLTSHSGYYPDPMAYLEIFESDNPYNNGGFINSEYDSIMESCRNGELANNAEPRWEALQRAEAILLEEDCGFYPLWQRKKPIVMKSELTNLIKNPLAPMWGYWEVEKSN